MSVYKPKGSRFWHYDFVHKGRRFHGSAGVETKRKAEAVERRVRDDAALGITPQDNYTLDEGFGRYWLEVGRHAASARQIAHRIKVALRLLGRSTRLRDITTGILSTAVERRRGETFARGFDLPASDGQPGRKAARYALSNDTVNSDFKPLRAMLNRARKTWEVKGLPEIDWASVLLPEAVTDIVHFTDGYQRAWLDACGPTEGFALELLLANGFRFKELFFAPEAYLDETPIGPALGLGESKGGAPRLIPLRPAHARQVAARAGIAKAAGKATIWLERDARGEVVEVSYPALQSRLRAAARRAGVSHRRLIHSTRHHFGTDFLAETGNLRLTQEAMRHADIKSTLVYAHALAGGLRDALLSRNSPEGDVGDGPLTLPTQGKRRRRA